MPIPNGCSSSSGHGDEQPLPELAGSVTARPQRCYTRLASLAEGSVLRPGAPHKGSVSVLVQGQGQARL